MVIVVMVAVATTVAGREKLESSRVWEGRELWRQRQQNDWERWKGQ